MMILAKAGQWAIKEVQKKDGKGNLYVLEKSRKNEQTGEWENQSLFLNPTEFATVAELLLASFADVVKAQAAAFNNRQTGGADY